jgi:hypothetical protein
LVGCLHALALNSRPTLSFEDGSSKKALAAGGGGPIAHSVAAARIRAHPASRHEYWRVPEYGVSAPSRVVGGVVAHELVQTQLNAGGSVAVEGRDGVNRPLLGSHDSGDEGVGGGWRNRLLQPQQQQTLRKRS